MPNGWFPIFVAVMGVQDWVNDNPLIVGAVVIGFLLVFRLFYKSGREQIEETARAFTEPHPGLRVVMPERKIDPSPFRRTVTCKINGEYRGTQVQVAIGNDTQYVSLITSRTNKWYLEFRAEIPSWPSESTLSAEGIAGRITALAGFSGVEVGHEEFDRTFRIKGPKQTVRQTLTDEAINALLKLKSMGYDFAIDGGELIVAGDPYKFEESVLRRTLNSMTAAVRRLDTTPKVF